MKSIHATNFNFKFGHFKFVNRENKLEQGSPLVHLEQGSPFGARKSIWSKEVHSVIQALGARWPKWEEAYPDCPSDCGPLP